MQDMLCVSADTERSRTMTCHSVHLITR